MRDQGTRNRTENLSWFLRQSYTVQRAILSDYPQLVTMLALHIIETEAQGYLAQNGPAEGSRYVRWGSNKGSISIGRQHIPVEVPRIRDTQEKKSVALQSYRELRKIERAPSEADAMHYGISTRNYPKAVGGESGFGLSKSSMSREIVEKSREAMKEFFARDLSEVRLSGLFIDGTYLGSQTMVIALGIDQFGQKKALSFAQSHTENKESVSCMLNELIERGLPYKQGFLCVMDGSKGLRAAIDEVFGPYVLIQRCRLHKRENILNHLAKRDQGDWKRKLDYAFSTSGYTEAKGLLRDLEKELKQLNPSAAKSLLEGQEDILCLQRLGVADLFKDSFSTTNCIEALNDKIKARLRRVSNWESADQRHRWLAWALLEIEPRFQRVKNAKNLPVLQTKVSEYIAEQLN